MEVKQELSEVLIAKMKDYVSSGKTGANKSNLASRTGVSRATISKYLQNDFSSQPSAETAFKILRFFDGKNEAANTIRAFCPEWWKSTGRFIIDDESIKYVEDKSQGHQFKFEKVHMRILEQAQLDGGAHDLWITKHFGTEIGIPARDDLIKGGYVERVGSCCFISGTLVENDFEKLLERIIVDAQNFCVDQVNEGNAVLGKFSWYMSSQAREESHAAIRELWSKLHEIKEQDIQKNLPRSELFKLNIFGNWSQESGV